MNYDHVKAIHIIFVTSWFAGLFYLPRLFVYHTEAHSSDSHNYISTHDPLYL